jgi:NAD(P)-dependent dehydrogenase (short-subunit alcohol dehydrogenase family)
VPQSFRVQGSIVLVTGGGSGIGRALAVHAAREGARSVVVADLDLDAAAQTCGLLAGSGHHAVRLDVSDERAVAALAAEVEETIAPIDLWCSNAGIHRGVGLGDDADWSASWGIHVRAHLYAGRHVLPRMAERGRGWLLVTASAAGLLSDTQSAPYAVTKHAAVALAEWLSIRFDAAGVSVSCLCPQGVRTAMNRDRRDAPTGAGANFLDPEPVADVAFAALRDGHFLALPHPEVAEYERRRAGDRDRWLAGMRRLRAALTAAAT